MPANAVAGVRDVDEVDAEILVDEVWESEGGRYGHRTYRRPDGTGWEEFWGTRIEDWGTRVFATFAEAARWANARAAGGDR